jgi:hypothetical protein
VPVDPGRHWLEAGITGIARPREWDAVVTVSAPGVAGEEVEFVALPDGRVVAEGGHASDPSPFAAALGGAIEPPYRAVAVRRDSVWAVGAVSIEVAELAPAAPGTELELTWDGSTLSLTVDTLPADPARADALDRIASARLQGRPYAARAHRLADELWEILVLPL